MAENKVFYDHGGITIYHGDCLEVREWLSADVLITDPPYGMAYVSSWTKRRPVANDHDASARDDALELWGEKPALVFGTWRVERPKNTRHVLIWHKETIGPGMGDLGLPWGNATEEIYVLGSGWQGRRRQNLLATAEQRGGTAGVAALIGHPTPKPLRLMGSLIECAPGGGHRRSVHGRGGHPRRRPQSWEKGDRRGD